MLVHLAATLDNWNPKLLDLIAKNHHIIVFNLQGVGESEGKLASASWDGCTNHRAHSSTRV